AAGSPTLLLEMHDIAAPTVDPGLPRTLSQRAETLAARTTLAGFLPHRRADLGLSVAQVAEAAVLPEPVIAGWEAGTEAAPTQLLRCAPSCNYPKTRCCAPAPADAHTNTGRCHHRRPAPSPEALAPPPLSAHGRPAVTVAPAHLGG